ncbi:unnamed protein product [Tetraodon nigroviridis]|uniref:Chromosome 12 SCAF14999, whole genome shotgun sequence n=1 Tax=Tetraodon nigroviridis TaxID=99883 RepID=Q4RSV6_TETNG|nr:unnamed protein product [Tetraodon nigroviridis]
MLHRLTREMCPQFAATAAAAAAPGSIVEDQVCEETRGDHFSPAAPSPSPQGGGLLQGSSVLSVTERLGRDKGTEAGSGLECTARPWRDAEAGLNGGPMMKKTNVGRYRIRYQGGRSLTRPNQGLPYLG